MGSWSYPIFSLKEWEADVDPTDNCEIRMIETIVDKLFVGFGIYTFILVLTKSMVGEVKKRRMMQFDSSACLMIAIAGVVYLFVIFFSLAVQFLSSDDPIQSAELSDRLFGTYSLGYWMPSIFIMVSQFLWFKRAREIATIRVIIGVLFLISIERIIVYVTSFHRDYLNSSWSIPIYYTLIEWLMGLALFAAVSVIFHVILTKLRSVRSKESNFTNQH